MVQEKYPEAQRQLFGPGFEHGLRARSEAADTIAIKASKVSIPGRGKQGFCGGERYLQRGAIISRRPISHKCPTISTSLGTGPRLWSRFPETCPVSSPAPYNTQR